MAETATSSGTTSRGRGRKVNARTKKKGTQTMSPAHKQALALGREQGRAVERYLDALAEANKPKPRGRQRTVASIRNELTDTDAKLAVDGASSLARIKLIQKRLDLEAELAARTTKPEPVDLSKLEADFVKVAKSYSESKGITYGAWSHFGVPRVTLKKAGIAP